MKNITFILTISVFVLFYLSVFAGQSDNEASKPLTLNKVTDEIYEIKGGVCNTGFIINEKEVIAIDAEMTPASGKEMINLIKQITDKPINHMILTHSDGDHVNGLPGWPADINIISHVNTKKDMEKNARQAGLTEHLPDQVFTDKMTIKSGDRKIELLYFGPAHKDGDIVVYLPEEKVAFIGDLIFLDREPLIKTGNNGSSFGVVHALKSILNLDVEIFVHGHDDIVGRKEIEQYIKDMEERQLKIKELIQQKKSVADIKKVLYPSGEPASKGKGPRITLVEIIYNEIMAQ